MVCTSVVDDLPSVQWNYAGGISMAVVSVVAGLENILVLTVLLSYNNFRTTSFRILTSLVYANLLCAVILAPMFAVRLLYRDAVKNCMFDSIRRHLSATLMGASCFTLGFMSYDKCRRLRSTNIGGMTKRTTYIVLMTCWFVASLLPLSFLNQTEYTSVVIDMFRGTVMTTVVVISCAALLLTLCCNGGCGNNGGVNNVLIDVTTTDGKPRRSLRSSVSLFSKKRDVQDLVIGRVHRYEARTVLLILIIYVIMFTPLYTHSLLTYTQTLDPHKLAVFHLIAMYVAVCNAVVNPLIYGCRMAVLRNHLVKVLKSMVGKKTEEGEEEGPFVRFQGCEDQVIVENGF